LAGFSVFSAVFFAAFLAFAVEEAEAAGSVADCPANGSAIIDMKNRLATQRKASRETEAEKRTTLIPSLYAAFAPGAASGNHWRYRQSHRMKQFRASSILKIAEIAASRVWFPVPSSITLVSSGLRMQIAPGPSIF
jgi:hypothetical protein